MKDLIIYLCLGLVFIFSFQCKEAPNEVTGKETFRQLTNTEQQIVTSANTFGVKILKEVNKSENDKNVFISPLSISYALGMTLNGAANATRDSIAQTLELLGLTDDEINRNYKSLMELLTSLDPAVIFQIANSIWCRDNLQVEQSFIDGNKQYFDAEIAKLNFSDPNASKIINAWVAKKTNGKIDKIVPDAIDPRVVMYLINAIYFKGNWTYQFDPKKTVDANFTTSLGSRVPTKLMTISGEFMYYENSDLQIIDLPYGNKKFSMTIVLPRSKNIDLFVNDLTEQQWNLWLSRLEKRKGTFFFPKFKLEYKKNLNDVLQALGMQNAFTLYVADFSRISKREYLFISNVEHKTFVEVNEEGTEAAAVTSVEISRDSVSDKFYMRVDKPFLFVIRDNHTNSVLFIGKITNP